MLPSTPSNDDFDDELLSAYLDDELTAAERARVEERLRTDPRAVALVEELRTLSGAVRLLPREILPRDLRRAVLAKVNHDDSAPAVIAMPTSSERWALRRRGLIWSAISIAAVLMLSIFQPAVEEEGDVARRSAEVSDGDGADEEQKRERFESPADADRPVRFNHQSPSLSAPAEPPAPASSVGDASDSEAVVAGTGAGGGGFRGGVGGEADDAKLDSFAADEATPATAPAQGNVESSLSRSAPAAPADGAGGQLDRSEGLAVERAAGGALAAAASNEVRKSTEVPRVVEITIARADGVSRFKQLLVDSKIVVNDGKAPAAVATANLSDHLQTAAPAEILVDASSAQVEHLLFLCRADKAFAEVLPGGERGADKLLAGAAAARELDVASGRSSSTEAKAPASTTLSVESNESLPATDFVKTKDDVRKSPDVSLYAYGAPAAAGEPSPAAPGSGKKSAGDVSGAARVQVLFRFLPVQAPATKAAK